jgi:biotin carboxylase
VIGKALGIATHSPRIVELVHDKQAMRARLRETGVDTTASAVVADVAALSAFVGDHGFPCVVKPVAGSGSVGLPWSETKAHSRGPSIDQRPI